MNRASTQLSKIYYDPKHPASYSNTNKLWLATGRKIPKKTITNWLIGQETYTRHKPRRLHFQRNCYILSNIDELWESDLIVMPTHFSEHNGGTKYILGIFIFNNKK